jgi:hypothetical protein
MSQLTVTHLKIEIQFRFDTLKLFFKLRTNVVFPISVKRKQCIDDLLAKKSKTFGRKTIKFNSV